ncbi:MAG: DUF3047 domain-containing protein [Desulfuromonadaceae bacterium]|nr:DUF3047 domain-containing protein [Desulfuromonadaceae bacterium]
MFTSFFKRMMTVACFVPTMLVSLIVNNSSSFAEEIQVSHFNTEGLSGWEPKIFKGITEYTLDRENGRAVVKATSKASASGLVHKIRFDPSKYGYLRWSWKVAHTIVGGNENTKAGDDYAARVYVLFPGKFFWQMKAINYIWANKLGKNKSAQNTYTSNARMIAVESGNEKAGQWLTEERDLREDYRSLFGSEPQRGEAIAIMTDTDDTGGSAEAWYGEISLATERTGK